MDNSCLHNHVKGNKDTGWLHCMRCHFPVHRLPDGMTQEEVDAWFKDFKIQRSLPQGWDKRFLDLAEQVSTWSKDPGTRCGAVIVRPDKTIASVGFNGFPRGCDDSPDLYNDRDVKLQRVIHAEVNAILNCYEKPVGYTMYTYPPGTAASCVRCTTQVIQSGIKKIVHYLDLDPPRDFNHGTADMTERMYHEAGVKVVHYSKI